jgi:hypothetical protein
MMIIYTQKKFLPEKRYVFNVLLKHFIGLDYILKFHESENYKVVLDNNKTVIFNDAFFSQFNEYDSYLYKENLPESIIYSKNQFAPEKDSVVIFGNEVTEVQNESIYIGNDIFAASFFMLTRWEEYVLKDRDAHNRFPDDLLLSQRWNFHQRPVLDEYSLMLMNIFKRFNIHVDFHREYKLLFTHDVDEIKRYSSFFKFLRALAGDLFYRKSLSVFFTTVKDYLKILVNLRKDPYNKFDYLMDLSERHNNTSYFFFIPGLKGEPDYRYDISEKKVQKIIQYIKSRGHYIGIHGSYRSYNNLDYYKEELNRLENIQYVDKINRQHYLRFQVPDTWQLLEDAGINSDTTIGFSNDWGFRAGTCHSFSVFNIVTRKELNLTEYPLIAMDTALKIRFQNMDRMFGEIKKAHALTKKYKGTFVLLWHNNNIEHPDHLEKILPVISK